MSRGIVLIAIDNLGYAYMAANLAYSLKRVSPEIPITLLADGCIEYIHPEDRQVFDQILPLSEDLYTTNGVFDPAKIKTHLYDHLPYDHNLYLDVDALAVSSVGNLFQILIDDPRSYITTIVSKGDHTNEKIEYSVWAKTSTIVEQFNVPRENEIVAVQSSWAYIRKDQDAERIWSRVADAFDSGFDLDLLKEKWGGGLPDELFVSGVLSHLGYDAHLSLPLLYFADTAPYLTLTQIIDEGYALISYFGNGTGRSKTPLRYWDLYDRLLRTWKTDRPHIYKSAVIKELKHANKKK